MVEVENANDGLMLLRVGHRFYPFNPSNNFSRVLPHFERYTELTQRGMVIAYNRLESKRRYSIVCFGEMRDRNLEFGVFCSTSRQYRIGTRISLRRVPGGNDFGGGLHDFGGDDFGGDIYCNRSVFWVQGRATIICFRLLDNQVKEIVLPLRHNGRDYYYSNAPFQSGGKLLVVELLERFKTDFKIYQLNDINDTWLVRYTINLERIDGLFDRNNNMRRGFYVCSVVLKDQDPNESYVVIVIQSRSTWKYKIISGELLRIHDFEHDVIIPIHSIDIYGRLR